LLRFRLRRQSSSGLRHQSDSFAPSLLCSLAALLHPSLPFLSRVHDSLLRLRHSPSECACASVCRPLSIRPHPSPPGVAFSLTRPRDLFSSPLPVFFFPAKVALRRRSWSCETLERWQRDVRPAAALPTLIAHTREICLFSALIHDRHSMFLPHTSRGHVRLSDETAT
jgi:hypothetical protein